MHIDATVSIGSKARKNVIIGSIYASEKTFANLVIDARVMRGIYNVEVMRNLALSAQLTADDDRLILESKLGLFCNIGNIVFDLAADSKLAGRLSGFARAFRR